MGLDKFHLNNSVQDGTYMNEDPVRRDGPGDGLPAARGTHALVELNGRKVGFYVLKEGFDKTFLRRHFKDANGNLYDGGFLQTWTPGCNWTADAERPQGPEGPGRGSARD